MTIEEMVLEKLRGLPPEKQKEVLAGCGKSRICATE